MTIAVSKRIKEITLQVIKADMIINWLLALMFIFFPRFFQRLIAEGDIFQIWLWRLIGITLIIFAGWQVKIIKRGKTTQGELGFLVLATFTPAALLAAGLFMDFPLYHSSRLLLWVADFYMLSLGAFYLYVLKKHRRASTNV
ncbi:MAG: hypothetical protein ACC618_00890 [Patescibacteria group bacterium]